MYLATKRHTTQSHTALVMCLYLACIHMETMKPYAYRAKAHYPGKLKISLNHDFVVLFCFLANISNIDN